MKNAAARWIDAAICWKGAVIRWKRRSYPIERKRKLSDEKGAQTVVTQIVQCEPNGEWGSWWVWHCFLLDLAAGLRSWSCAEPEQIIPDPEHWQSSHSMKNAVARWKSAAIRWKGAAIQWKKVQLPDKKRSYLMKKAQLKCLWALPFIRLPWMAAPIGLWLRLSNVNPMGIMVSRVYLSTGTGTWLERNGD
jgi:hypothetical protein